MIEACIFIALLMIVGLPLALAVRSTLGGAEKVVDTLAEATAAQDAFAERLLRDAYECDEFSS